MSRRSVYCKNPAACIAKRTGKCPCMSAPSQKELHPSEYYAWVNMKTRCSNPHYSEHHRYAGRGISICEDWINSFETFFAAIGPKPSSTCLLDRIDNSKGYEPDNIKWSEPTGSSRNRDVVKPFKAFGMTKLLPEWEEFIGRSRKTIWRRIQNGWPVDMAITADPMPYKFRRVSNPIAEYEIWWRKSFKVDQVYVRRGLYRYKLTVAS